MTSIRHPRPDSDGTALPELPPACRSPRWRSAPPTCSSEAADLPQPGSIFIYDHQAVSLQFAPEQASVRAITRWRCASAAS